MTASTVGYGDICVRTSLGKLAVTTSTYCLFSSYSNAIIAIMINAIIYKIQVIFKVILYLLVAIASFANYLPEIAELLGNRPKYGGSYKVINTAIKYKYKYKYNQTNQKWRLNSAIKCNNRIEFQLKTGRPIKGYNSKHWIHAYFPC